jgi:ABC-type dipeptide/oligopeptide/nickel transport system ATPase component
MDVCDLFTKGSNHWNISVILITHNLFHLGRFSREISPNAKYLSY